MRIELTTEIDGKKVVGLEGIKQLADAGNIEALNLLGEWLLTGFECSPDVNYAFGCFEKAARGGNTQAMLNLGLCYIEGHGTAKNFYAAERWIRAADELGDEEAEGGCEELYLTSIGSHKPSLRALVDYMYSKHPKGNVSVDAELLKKEMINHLILQEFGKSDDEIEALKGKVTENDIAAYESMNDLYYDDSSDSDMDLVFDRTQYIKNLLANIESHSFILQNEKSRSGKTKTQFISVNLRERKNIATHIKLVYHISKKNNKALLKNLLAMGKECYAELDFEDDLSWYERAMFDIVPDVLRAFSEAELSGCVSAIGNYLLEIQTRELQNAFDENDNNQGQLRLLQAQISESRQYGKSVIDEWTKKISDRLYELDIAMLSKLFDEAGTDYEKLVGLHKKISDDTFEPKAKSEWLRKTADLLNIVQADILEKICDIISNLDYTALVLLYEDTKNKYTFNRDTLDKYLAIIAKPIDEHEISVLSELCDNTDVLSSDEYTAIIKEIEKLSFKASNKQKYLDDISQKLKNARVLESCEERYLEDYDLDQLNDRVRAIHFSTFPAEIKSELSQRIAHYIDLIYECKDKNTVRLLSDCEPENIVNLSVAELSAVKDSLQEHIRLSPAIKEELIKHVEVQINIKEFDKKFVAAGDNYDLLVAAKNALPTAKLPEAEVQKYEALLYTKIVDAQRKALAELVAIPADETHAQICKRLERAKHFTFDKHILDESLAILESSLNDFECKTLEEICGDLSTCTVEDIEQLREKIRKLGFKKENTKSFKERIDARYGDLIFENLSKKCTQWDISQLATTEDGVTTLLSELQNCGKDKALLEPYIKRVTAFLAVQTQLRADVSELYQKHFTELQAFTVAEMSKLTFPQYSRLNVMCEFKPERVSEKQSRLTRFKVEGLEQIVFIFDDSPGANTFSGGFCITNLAIHCLTDGRMKYIPLESITEIKTGKLFNSISVSGTSDSFKISVQEDFVVRNALANTLQRIVSVATERKRMAATENQNLATLYSAKYDECFANTPIPNDKTFADRATEIKQEEAHKAETIANSPALPLEELMKAIPELVSKYGLSTKYHVVGTQSFMTKLPKARVAYATYDQSELPLMLEDHTIFGSAKDGFVLTNKAMYIHAGGTNGKVSLERIVSVFDSYDAQQKMHRICMNIKDFNTANGNAYMSYTSDDSTANTLIKFWTEVLELLNRGRAVAEPVAEVTSPAPQINTTSENPASEDNLPWLCNCGKTNEGKFCPNCGAKKETGTPMWKCSCGNVNKGKFCPKCGSKKP